MTKLNIGFVGVGSIAQQRHLPSVQKLENARIAAIADIAPGRAAEIAAKYGAQYHYTDYNEMLANPNIDAVVVAAPNYVHAPATIAALKAGKHVLCEKPLALNAAQAQEMVTTARQTGKTLMVALNNRFRSDVRVLRRHAEAGDLGDIYYVKCGWLRRRGNPFGWFAQKEKSGGGPLIDLGIHCIDLSRYIMGNPKPVSVTGMTYNKFGAYEVKDWAQYKSVDAQGQQTSDVEDLASAFIRFDNGATMVVDVSWAMNIKNEINYYEFYGTRGGAKLNPVEIATQLHGHLADIEPVYRDTTDVGVELWTHFVDCVLQGKEPICPGEHGLLIAKILDAIYESARTGREVRLAE